MSVVFHMQIHQYKNKVCISLRDSKLAKMKIHCRQGYVLSETETALVGELRTQSKQVLNCVELGGYPSVPDLSIR